MSAEKIIYEKQVSNLVTTNPLLNKIEFSGRVDINDLLARARKEKEKNDKVNLVFLGLVLSIITIVGIILSF
jgi:hypothetical protein